MERVLATDPLDKAAADILISRGHEVELWPSSRSQEEVIEAVKGYDALVVRR